MLIIQDPLICADTTLMSLNIDIGKQSVYMQYRIRSMML